MQNKRLNPFTHPASLLFGILNWKKGEEGDDDDDLFVF